MKAIWESLDARLRAALVSAALLIVGAISEAVLTYIDSLNPGV